MANHIPRLCDRCGGPLTAARECTRCPGRQVELRPDPLSQLREILLPWVRGQVACR